MRQFARNDTLHGNSWKTSRCSVWFLSCCFDGAPVSTPPQYRHMGCRACTCAAAHHVRKTRGHCWLMYCFVGAIWCRPFRSALEWRVCAGAIVSCLSALLDLFGIAVPMRQNLGTPAHRCPIGQPAKMKRTIILRSKTFGRVGWPPGFGVLGVPQVAPVG